MAARGSHQKKSNSRGSESPSSPLPSLAGGEDHRYLQSQKKRTTVDFFFLLLRSALSSSSSVGFSSASSLLCYGRELLSCRSGGGRLRSSGGEARRGGGQISVEAVEDGAATPNTEDHGSVGVEAGSARRGLGWG